MKPDSQNCFGPKVELLLMGCTLREGRLVYTLPAKQSEMKRESGFTLHCSSVGKRISRKRRKYISSSLSINFPCNYTWLKSSAEEGPGNRETGLSLEK